MEKVKVIGIGFLINNKVFKLSVEELPDNLNLYSELLDKDLIDLDVILNSVDGRRYRILENDDFSIREIEDTSWISDVCIRGGYIDNIALADNLGRAYKISPIINKMEILGIKSTKEIEPRPFKNMNIHILEDNAKYRYQIKMYY